MPECSTLCHPDEPVCALTGGPCDAAELGQWNAWAAAGGTPQERRERLAKVPAQYREQVESHVRTVFAIRARRQLK